MPLYEIQCNSCGAGSEVLLTGSDEQLACPACGSSQVTKLLSAPSSLSGRSPQRLPGPGDSACCGSSPAQAGCAGPGSCCGKSGPA